MNTKTCPWCWITAPNDINTTHQCKKPEYRDFFVVKPNFIERLKIAMKYLFNK